MIKINLADPKSKKTYKKEADLDLIGKKIGDKINGNLMDLPGYELEIRGGSDDSGFPMVDFLNTATRKRILSGKTKGLHNVTRKGERIRKTVRGNTISNKTVQVNIKVIKYGAKSVEELWGIAPKAAAEEKAEE